ncbi:MAG: HD domain-containing protein [Gammaproteobacteria bacterium]|nr:HD domain-containing protein [Gammaproteobacteria bacterium]
MHNTEESECDDIASNQNDNISENDHYADHLAQVNETQDVISNTDIVNEQGILLCKKGMQITKKTASRLIQHKLTQPIENSINLTKSITNDFLYKKLLSLQDTYPDLHTIQNQLNFSHICKDQFVSTLLQPIVIQKLTVMNEQISEQIDKAVFSAWFSMLIATEMGLDKHEQKDAFLAGLLHDIGFIHLSPELLNKKGALSSEEWRAIQSHVVIGKVMLEKYDNIPLSVSTAVLEHHERCDGAGYPANKNEDHLSVLGQIVGIADSIYAIRTRQFSKHNRTMFDLMPYLQMNAHTYFYDVYKAVATILKRTGLKMALPESSDISAMANNSLLRSQSLSHAIDYMQNNNVTDLAAELPGNKGKALFKISTQVIKMTSESGLVKNELHTWLQDLIRDPDKSAIAELNEIDLMLNELHWQLNNAYRSCDNSLVQENISSNTLFKLRDIYNIVGLCLGDLEDKL